jgi:HK97 family phage major capsid protein
MTHTMTNEPSSREIKAAVEALGQTFEEFKAANEEARAAQSRGGDVLLEEKVQRLNAELSHLSAKFDRLQMAQARPHRAAAGDAHTDAGMEHKRAFVDKFLRKGLEAGLQALEEKALSTGSPADGGYAVPLEIDQRIEALLKDVSPIRRIASVVQIGSANYRKLVNLSSGTSGWVSETAARPETSATQFAEVVPPLGEVYANPAATQAMLDDAYFDVESWLADEIATEFGAQEGAAFVNGNGTNKPKGFLAYTTAATADGARAFGTLQHIITGVNGAFPASDPADKLIDLIHALRPVYRSKAVFVMNTNTVALIRKFKDADGNYLWRPGLMDGDPATLLGYPLVEAQDMPDLSTGSLSVAFGNFERGYVITDRTAVRVLRDPFSNKPYVHFYATKRVGGGVVNSEAIKLLKFTA